MVTCLLSNLLMQYQDLKYLHPKLLFKTKMTKVFSKILLMKSSGRNFIFLPAFYLINWVMKAPKNFGKMTILKI